MDKRLEKQVVVFIAEEGNKGLYEIIQELGYYKEFSEEERIKIAIEILNELLVENLIWIERYTDNSLEIILEPIENKECLEIFKSPSVWKIDSNPMYVIKINQAGMDFLNEANDSERKALTQRLFNVDFKI